MGKEKNSFKVMMSSFSDDDILYLEAFDEEANTVAGSPMSHVTNDVKFGMTMISSFDEAVTAGYPIATNGSNKILDDKLDKYFQK